MAPAAQQQQLSPQQLNALQRQAVLASAVSMEQGIYSQTVVPLNNPVLLINPRNVGFLKSFLVYFTLTIHNTDATNALTLTNLGLANVFSNITFTDLSNNQRINTAGWHIAWLNAIRHRKPYAGGTVSFPNEMTGLGENYPVIQAPASIAASATATVSGYLGIPLVYSDDDLRGGIYANVVNAVMQLALTFNPQFFVAAGADSTLAVYKGTTSAVITAAQVTVYQEYLDQLPQGQQGVILPNLDVSTIYDLKMSQFQNIPTGQDFSIQYANFRSFLSTFAIYNHDGTADTGRVAGGDVNYWSLQAANFTNFWKLDPITQTMRTRQIFATDFPVGGYYFSSRKRPVSTVQYGNVELNLNPKTSTTASYVLVGWESFSLINTLTQAGSLANNG
jgi:P3 major capsid protein